MANKRIIDLTAAASLALTDVFEIDTGALSLKLTGQQVYNLIVAQLNAVGVLNLGGNNIAINADGSMAFGTAGSGNLNPDGGATFGGAIQAPTVQIGSGAIILTVLSATAVLDFGSTSAGTSTDLTIALAGAALGDVVMIGVPNASTLANGVFTSWVSSANTVKVRFTNTNLVTALDPASGTFRVAIIQF